jgi:outer membrane protein OmpA-like peptidoglycan-associated protein
VGAAALVASFASFVSSPPARAEGLALDRFHAAPAGDRFLGLPSPYVAGHLDVHAMLLAEYAYNPLVLKQTHSGATVASVVAHQAIIHVDATLAIKDRFLVNVDVPVVAIQGGDVDKSALHTADFGDLRLGLRARLFGDDGSAFQIGLGGYVWAPTGTGDYVSDHKVRGLPYVAAGGVADRVVWSVAVGPELRFAQVYGNSVQQGTSFDTNAGLAFLVGKGRGVQLGAELLTSFVVAQPKAHNINAEALLHARYRFMKRFEIGAGLGAGIGAGIGTPASRALAFFAYVPVSRPQHTEGEKAPVPVRLERGPTAPPPGAEPPPPLLELQIEVVGDEMALSEDVPMATGSPEIDPSGDALVHAVAEFLIAHPEIRRVEVRGHSEVDDARSANERLAQRRAEVVRQALISHGVDSARLTAKGDGPSRPAGRAKNRRVEFKILELGSAPKGKAPKGKAPKGKAPRGKAP